MIIKDLFKLITKVGKTATKTTKGSLKFMDDILEKEYIINAVEDIKEATGKVVEKSGELYQNAKDSMDGMSMESVTEDVKKKYEEVKEDLEEKADEIREELIRRSEEE